MSVYNLPKKKILKNIIKVCICGIVVVAAIMLLLGIFVNIPFDRKSGIENPGHFYKNEKVLILMPHQDDEIYGMASTILNYIRAGSEVSVVYSTNGDYYSPEDGPIRIEEAEAVLTNMGIASKNIYFLGYGNNYKSKEKAIYTNSENVVVSHAGCDHTYGINEHPDFHFARYNEHALYTRENLRSDIKDVILHIRPTIIYCVDFDTHVDHRTLSLLFEEAMLNILQKHRDYKPRVFKIPVYLKKGTVDFFNELNQNSITKPAVKSIYMDNNYDTDIPGYAWDDRLRLPSAQGIWGWTRETSYLNDLFLMYKSQNDKSFVYNANSDDVAWERRTDSFTYDAQIFVTSGEYAQRLNDFKWIDTEDVVTTETTYDNYLWQPSLADDSKTVKFTFDTAKTVSSVVVLEDPDALNNILKLSIYDSAGNLLFNGAPNKYGQKSEFIFDTVITDEISLTIDSYEGIPGIAEVEIYEDARDDAEIIKLCFNNKNETFIYNVLIDKNESEIGLKLYCYPIQQYDWNNYLIEVSENASYRLEGDVLYVSGDDVTKVTITDINNKELNDSIIITKISKPKKIFYKVLQKTDKLIYEAEMFYENKIKRYTKFYYALVCKKVKSLFLFAFK